MMDEIGFHAEHEERKRHLAELREAYSGLLAEYGELRTVVLPNVKTEYMMKVGHREYKLHMLMVEVRRVRRAIALRQAAANRGEKISDEEVEATLEREFAEYLEALEEERKSVEAAEKHFAAEKLPPEESKHIQKLYREWVKKLHPDLNPDLPEAAEALWHRIVEAYNDGDWAELYLLLDMAEEVLADADYELVLPDSGTALEEEIARITEKKRKLVERIDRLKKAPPLCYRELLSDSGKVAARREELERELKLVGTQLKEVSLVLEQIRSV